MILTVAFVAVLIVAGCAPAASPAPSQSEVVGDTEQAGDGATEGRRKNKLSMRSTKNRNCLNPYIATQTAAGEANSFVIEGLLDVDPEGESVSSPCRRKCQPLTMAWFLKMV